MAKILEIHNTNLSPANDMQLSLGRYGCAWNELYVAGTSYLWNTYLEGFLDLQENNIYSLKILYGISSNNSIDMQTDGRIILTAIAAGTPFNTPDITLSGTVFVDDNIGIYSTKQLYFRDDNISIASYTDGHIDINADTSIDFNINGDILLLTSDALSPFVNLSLDLGDTTHFYGDSYLSRVYLENTSTYFDNNSGDIDVYTTTAKTLELQTVVWDDLRVTPGSFDRPGTSDPDLVVYNVGAGGVNSYLYEFAANDIATFTVQLPHSYKTGEDIKVHIHWTPGPKGTTESGNSVGWELQYSWANINGTFGTMQTVDLSDACDGTNHKHQMTPDVVIDGSPSGGDAHGISSMLICNIKRAADTWAGTGSGNLPMFLEIDFHFPIDTIGSRQSSSK